VGDLVKFKLVVIEVDDKEEEAIKAIKIGQDMESFHVGFLPHHIVHGHGKEEVVKRFGQVLDLCKELNDTTKQRNNRMRFGIA
jgi:hypothetical protein